MQDYCLEIGKLITGFGLILDLIGIIILVPIDIIKTRIEDLQENPIRPEEPEQPLFSQPRSIWEPLPIDVNSADWLYYRHSPQRNLKKLKWGFGLLISGFVVQFIALFIELCINLF
jgi:hypothetical protein